MATNNGATNYIEIGKSIFAVSIITWYFPKISQAIELTMAMDDTDSNTDTDKDQRTSNWQFVSNAFFEHWFFFCVFVVRCWCWCVADAVTDCWWSVAHPNTFPQPFNRSDSMCSSGTCIRHYLPAQVACRGTNMNSLCMVLGWNSILPSAFWVVGW